MILPNILWLAFVYISSEFEAYYFHKEAQSISPNTNLHPYFMGVRICIYFAVFGLSKAFVLFLLPHLLMFPFLHDGIYYATRNNLNPLVYPLRWKDKSTTTNAKMSYDYTQRETMFIIGVILWITALFFSYLLHL